MKESIPMLKAGIKAGIKPDTKPDKNGSDPKYCLGKVAVCHSSPTRTHV